MICMASVIALTTCDLAGACTKEVGCAGKPPQLRSYRILATVSDILYVNLPTLKYLFLQVDKADHPLCP